MADALRAGSWNVDNVGGASGVAQGIQISHTGVDVIGLQESTEARTNAIVYALGDDGWASRGLGDGNIRSEFVRSAPGTGYPYTGLAIVARVPMSNLQCRELAGAGGIRMLRVTLGLPVGALWFYAAHPRPYDKPQVDASRKFATEGIVDSSRRIVVGDLNAQPGTESIESWYPQPDPWFTEFDDDTPTTDGDPNSVPPIPPKKLDYIFYSHKTIAKGPNSLVLPSNLSDHHIIWTDLKVG